MEIKDDKLHEKLDADAALEGADALAFLAVHFSNATNGNYEPEQLFESTDFLPEMYKISITKVK